MTCAKVGIIYPVIVGKNPITTRDFLVLHKPGCFTHIQWGFVSPTLHILLVQKVGYEAIVVFVAKGRNVLQYRVLLSQVIYAT